MNNRRQHSVRFAYGVRIILAAALSAAVGFSHGADIRVLSNGAVQDVEQALAAQFSIGTGHRLQFTFGTPGVIQEKLAAGQKADVIVLPETALQAMDKAGALRPGSLAVFARGGIGVAVRKGVPPPDISTPEALRKTLLDAKSIIYADAAKGSPSAVVIARILEQLNVADTVKSKLMFRNAVDGGVELIAKGDAELGIFNVSEIAPVAGVALVGPLPPALQRYSTYAAAVAVDSPVAEAAAAFVGFLSGVAARERWIAGGFEPPAAAK
jgi:molybdate transport system substrate-binding protein